MTCTYRNPLGDVLSAASGKGGRLDRVRFTTHRSREILLVDLTNCNAQNVIELLSEVQRIVTAQPRNFVLTLGDLTGAEFSRAAVTRMKEVAVFDRPYVKRSALVGAQCLPKIFYDALKTFSEREFCQFEKREDAMDWLVREEEG